MTQSKKIITILIKLLILALFFTWIARGVQLSDLRFPRLEIISWLIIAIITIVFIPHLFWVASIWRSILRSFNQTITWVEAWKTCSISSLGRYIPGKIWLFVGKATYAKKLGLGSTEIGISMILELVGNMLGAGIVSVFCLLYSDILFQEFTGNIWLFGAAGLVSVVFVHPRVLIPLLNKVLSLFKQDPINARYNARSLYSLVFRYVLDWVYQGILFFILVRQIADGIFVAQFPTFLFVFTFSWLVGFLSLLTPGGIGVREGIMLLLLQKAGIQSQPAIYIAILSRIWMTIPELIMGSWFWLFNPSGTKTD